jgi:hypothetical protein
MGDSSFGNLNIGFEVFAPTFNLVVSVRPLFRLPDEALVLGIGVQRNQRRFCIGDRPIDHQIFGVKRENVEKFRLCLRWRA